MIKSTETQHLVRQIGQGLPKILPQCPSPLENNIESDCSMAISEN